MQLPPVPAEAALGRAALVVHCCSIHRDSHLLKLIYRSSKTSHKIPRIPSDGDTADCTADTHVQRRGPTSATDALQPRRKFWQNQISPCSHFRADLKRSRHCISCLLSNGWSKAPESLCVTYPSISPRSGDRGGKSSSQGLIRSLRRNILGMLLQSQPVAPALDEKRVLRY